MTIQQALRSHAKEGINQHTIKDHLLIAAERIDYLEKEIALRSAHPERHYFDVGCGPHDLFRVYIEK